MQLKYDYLTIYLMTFWNPENAPLYGTGEGSNSFTGKGFQFMLVFDF